MTDVKLALRGLRGESFADVARRTGSISGTVVSSSATDPQVLDALVAAASLTSSVTSPNVYANTSAGLAAVSNGQLFWVESGGLLTLYRDDSGVATELASLATTDAFTQAHDFILLGDTTTRAIDTNLGGTPVGADIGQIFIGNTVSSADAITIDANTFPSGIAFRRFQGTPGSPTEATASNLQLGYTDFRAYFEGEFYNAGSFDCVIDGGGVTTTGCPPPTQMRWSISDGLVVFSAMELKRTGTLEIGANVGEDYFGPSALGDCNFFVNQAGNDYAAVIAGRPASGAGYGLRLHTSGTTNSDYPLIISHGAGSGSIGMVFSGAGRAGIGVTSPVCSLDVAGPIRCGQYTVATVPLASLGAGQEIYVSDEAGGGVKATSDGTNWRRSTDRAVIS